MNPIAQNFVSQEQKTFRFRIGRMLASSLTGFIAGMIVASILWIVGIWYLGQLQKIQPIASPVICVSAPHKG
jgi:hypothetical protein